MHYAATNLLSTTITLS